MRYFFTICLLFSAVISFGQVDSVSLKSAMADFDKALIEKNENLLSHLLNDHVTYGHSNGWVQSKADIINDLRSGKLVYNRLEVTSMTIAEINSEWATVRTNTNANVASTNVAAFDIKLQILQVWIKAKDGWQLIARQGVRLQ